MSLITGTSFTTAIDNKNELLTTPPSKSANTTVTVTFPFAFGTGVTVSDLDEPAPPNTTPPGGTTAGFDEKPDNTKPSAGDS